MKRVLILIVLLMLLCSTALSEELDLTIISLDELVTLRRGIDAEILDRIGSDSSSIYSGNYIVGEDISAGKYTIKCLELSGHGYGMDISIYKLEEDGSILNTRISFVRLAIGESAFVSLRPGLALVVKSGIGVMSIVDPFWAL